MLERRRAGEPGAPLELFVIYEGPREFPGHFVVRRWENDVPTGDFALAPSLDAARAEVPRGLFWIPRSPEDQAHIVEVWL